MAERSGVPGRHDLVRDASRVGSELGRLVRVLGLQERNRVRSYELSVSQSHALQALAQHGPMTVTDLGDRLHLEKSTASRLAKGLVKKNLIRRRSRRVDGRVAVLQLTESGQRTARHILNDRNEEYVRLLNTMDPESRRALPTILKQLNDSITR